jgi:hypothetical protein
MRKRNNQKHAYQGNREDSHPHGGTPDWLIDALSEAGGVLFDPCPNNPPFDGLKIEWPRDQLTFVNPPYTRGELAKWVEKAFKHPGPVVMLIPAYTDTKYFHEFIFGHAHVLFFKGRLKFKGYAARASFPSCLVIYEGEGDSVRSLIEGHSAFTNTLASTDLLPPSRPPTQASLFDDFGGV